ncbi:MAG TPA: 50S ribosomal protein L17 [Candidatus Limnocylindrales bacterium]|nr:50S ribosomal protein L17 [Candidatus Limnocylindrales bacterium]
MRKQVFGRQFKRDANERKAMFKNLLTSLVLEERIKTTIAKAKAIKADADKLITKAKKGGDAAYKALHPNVNQDAVVKLISDIGPRFATRTGGYTRVIKLGKRRVADNAPMAIIEWTEPSSKVAVQGSKSPKKAKKTAKVTKTNVKKDATANTNLELAKPAITKKEEKVQKPGMFKRLVTRQKKGQ